MAWNEPGGDGNDPWKRRGDQGPPDLDEALRQFQNKVTGIFGGGKSGGSGGSGRSQFKWSTVGIAVVVLAIAYGAWGVYQIDQQERGVVFRFGRALTETKLPGLHWNPPLIDVVTPVNITRVNSHSHQALMLTEDENIVDLNLTVQFVVGDPRAFLVNVRNPGTSLDHATESALRHVVGSSTMDSVITEGREAVAIEVQDRLQSYLNRYGTGITVSKVNIDRSGPPQQVQEAFDDVQKAKEDEVRAVNEANAYAEGVVPGARGEAQKAIEEANAYREQVIAEATGEASRFNQLLFQYELAPEVTRDRLYINSIEAVLQNSSKVMVDVEGGNNMMVLPLDSITSRGGAGSQSADEIADQVLREIEARQAGRPRESR